jgi:Flp pilus assembly protein TadG
VRTRFRLFARRQDGSVAIQFGLVVLPFVAMIAAIMETSMVFFADQTLQTAVTDSARLIMTGQAQGGNFNQASFKSAVCARIVAMFDCPNKMYIDVRTYTNFGSISSSLPIDANGNLINNFTYQPGGPGDIVVVKLMYQWPIYLHLYNLTLANMSGNKRLLVATAAFRNEPY